MATPSEKLAQSLERLKALQDDNVVAIASSLLGRTDRERLLKNGFISEVSKGWYISLSPEMKKGDTTGWYSSYWTFCSDYLNQKFKGNWVLSPEQSLSIQVSNYTVPQQLAVRSKDASNNIVNLAHNTSILAIKEKETKRDIKVTNDGLRVYPLPEALINISPRFFLQNPIDVRSALLSVNDASAILSVLLKNGKSVVAGRMVGAFRNIGRSDISDEIKNTFEFAGYEVRENDPFQEKIEILSFDRVESPYVSRIRMMWSSMRQDVIDNFKKPEIGIPEDKENYFKKIEEIFVTDAYNSLSIEGYKVSEELIIKIRDGKWNPEKDKGDRERLNALAAKGYFDAFNKVKESISMILDDQDQGNVVKSHLNDWYRSMFSPSVTAGILEPSDLAGYRSINVYIGGSRHTPPNASSVRDAMPELFRLIKEEPVASVRAILGHFIFVYIHPFMDGNGRTGRFLMNTMFASGGFDWTVIPVEKREQYMSSLEDASVRSNIKTFTKFINGIVESNEYNHKPKEDNIEPK